MHPVLDAIEAIAIKCQEAITSDTPIQVDIIKVVLRYFNLFAWDLLLLPEMAGVCFIPILFQ